MESRVDASLVKMREGAAQREVRLTFAMIAIVGVGLTIFGFLTAQLLTVIVCSAQIFLLDPLRQVESDWGGRFCAPTSCLDWSAIGFKFRPMRCKLIKLPRQKGSSVEFVRLSKGYWLRLSS